MIDQARRERFDALVDEAVLRLPESVRRVLDEIPLIVLDRPTPAMLEDLECESGEASQIAGLHSGIMRTDQSVEHSGELPGQIHIFREGTIWMAGGWMEDNSEFFEGLFEQIWITLLHEIGHEMGLEEDDLEELGYD